MRHSPQLLCLGLVTSLLSVWSCSGGGGKRNPFQGGSGGDDGTGTGGSSMPSGTGGSGGRVTSTGGSPGDAGNGASGGSSGAGGATGGTPGGASDGGPGDGSVATPDGPAAMSDDAGGGGNATAITKVAPTPGCGKPPGMTGRRTIMTMGTKPQGCADSKCGPWMYERVYFVMLPAGYDNNKAYPLVLQGPGCGAGGQAVYPLNDGTAANVGNTVIRVGVSPPPDTIGHATNPGQGCFDDKEGDDSVDFPMYEAMYDKLAEEFCFDRNRVFAGGNSSGAWWSNELGCKYAGDPTRPIRGIFPNTGGLPDQPQYKPTCTSKPMAGMWTHEVNDTTNPFTGNKYAIARAMMVNGCTIGNSFDNTMFDNFPIGGNNPANTCRLIKGCPALYPLVVCPLPGNGHGSHDNVVNPGASTFIKMFSMGEFITP